MQNRNFNQGDNGTQHRFLWRDGDLTADGSTYDEIRVPSYWELTYVENLPGFGAPENTTGGRIRHSLKR